MTGATAGFGEAIARRFAADGYRLIVSGRRFDRLENLAASLSVPTHILPLDVRDRAAIDAAIDALPAGFAAVDVLVNNAGLAAGLGPAHEADWTDWEQMIDTNIKGLVYLTRRILPGMVERGRGHVVNIGSVAGSYPYPGGNVYGATKAFVKQFSLNLLNDLVATPVRVTNIEPGAAETEFSLVRFHGDADRAKGVYRGMTPLSAEDVAEAVRWAVAQPPHVNINRIEMAPTSQSFGGVTIHRTD